MGEVYKARDTRLDGEVAVKVSAAELSASSEQRQRFERKARTISQLSHPHISGEAVMGLTRVRFGSERGQSGV
jgi:serine/threonine protein kinase